MKKVVLILMMLAPVTAGAAGGGNLLFHYDGDLSNEVSLQRGATYFMNYCSGCHSLTHLRYNRIAEDLNIPEEVMRKNLMFTTDNFGDQIEIARVEEDAVSWFGAAPPDLTLVARHRGTDWVYNFLKSFYLDPAKANGVNNPVLPGTAMPHVLGGLQGWQSAVTEEHKDKEGNVSHAITGFEIVKSGSLAPAEYDAMVTDIVNFLDYAGEPIKLKRYLIGTLVLFFLLFFTLVAYLLKLEFWKDVH